ncbi:MAG: ABC transporter permease [Vicinamibacterales bacterium]|nr:ABC transporter permease [Vicinamibacterales bacterium]HJO18170.1 ABC transporter permease [Vicinamibacterales bacterium]
MKLRAALLREIGVMAFETLRANKMRSALTIVGVVIGITAIVGMTSLVRGFDRSFREMLEGLGPNTIFVAKFSGISFMSGNDFIDLIRRPNLTPDDARALERLESVRFIDTMLGSGLSNSRERISYRGEETKRIQILGATEYFAQVGFIPLEAGRFFTAGELQHRRAVVVLGQTPLESLFRFTADPIGKKVRVAGEQYTVIGVMGPRPSPGGFNVGQDDLAVIPYTRYQSQFGVASLNWSGGQHRDVTITVVPRDGQRAVALREIEEVMRIRHGLRLDEPNDFDLVTQDAMARIWQQTTQAVFLALVVISSIALLVGGIGVMAIMTMSVTERTSEIGLRKALGAKPREILWQFLVEASVLTLAGGVLGVLLGSGTGLLVHFISGFPISLPWWSFALGLGFSATVGLVFGMVPAIRASRLDPIEALHHE